MILEKLGIIIADEDAHVRGRDRHTIPPIEEVLDSVFKGGKVELPLRVGPLAMGRVPVERFDVGPVFELGIEMNDFGIVVVKAILTKVKVARRIGPVTRDSSLARTEPEIDCRVGAHLPSLGYMGAIEKQAQSVLREGDRMLPLSSDLFLEFQDQARPALEQQSVLYEEVDASGEVLVAHQLPGIRLALFD